MVTFETRTEADAAAVDGLSVCATLLPDGQPVYFLLPSETDDDACRRIAFSVRHGREMSAYELSLLKLVEARS